MAINVDLYDLVNYPSNPKKGTIDIVQMVPAGYQGDEQFVLKFSTTAYSDAVNNTAIQDIYVQEMVCGWAKSSGFAGTGGKFTITSSTNKLRVNIDGCSGGSYNGYYEIELDTGVNIAGETIASDIQTKLRAVSLDAADSSHRLGYLNCVCIFRNNKFFIQSGTVSNSFVGSGKSSVRIYTTTFSDSANDALGFNIPVESEIIASSIIKEVVTTSNYTVGDDELLVGNGLGVQDGDALCITDGVNKDYFTAVSGTVDINIKVPNQANNGFNAIKNNYTAGAKVQILSDTDPEFKPTSPLDTVDKIARWGVMSLINQIDFSG